VRKYSSPSFLPSEIAMDTANADRNLLFGMLALQMDFINQNQLVAAMHAWVLTKNVPLGPLLVERGDLTADRLALLEALVQEHVRQHDNDPEKSLAALDTGRTARSELARIADADTQASLRKVASAAPRAPDPYVTSAGSVGTPSSSGLRFRVLRPFARGGLGEVLVARDEELQREVALKQMLDQHADEPESRTRFLMEAEITGGLEHPGIVPVYGLGHYADGRPFYAMRFIRGDSLKDAIERFHKADQPGRDPGERALALRGLLRRFVDVCQAIAYAHSRGVVHRDLKPGNIMLGKYGETLVLDWGLAKPLDSPEHPVTSPEGSLMPRSLSGTTETQMGMAVGTPQFMSPEQAAGRLQELGTASDVYSLGATLYCVLTGRPPVTDSDVGQVLQKVERGDFPQPRAVKADIPAALEAICLKAMALTPEDRYAAPHLLAEDVERWLADEPVTAFAEPWTQTAARWLRRHRTLAISAASTVLVALISLIVATVLLTAANERERQAKLKAEENFQMAREAVDRYHTEVSEDILLNEPGMDELRKKLLGAARDFYEKFVHERAGDGAVKGEFGRALFRLAQITGDIDSEARAIPIHLQARQVFQDLGADYATDLARCNHHLGRLYRKAKNFPDAESCYREAEAQWKQLTTAHPGDNFYEAELARTQLGLGNTYQEQSQLARALEEYEKARLARVKLVRADPGNAAYQRDLATTYGDLVMVYLTRDENTKAEEALRQAEVLHAALVKASPHISQYRDDLARTHYNLGDVCRAKDGRAAAVDAFEQARMDFAILVQRHPAVLVFRTRLADTLTAQAEVLSTDGMNDKAIALCNQALEIKQKLADETKEMPYRAAAARGYAKLGNIYRAAARPDDADQAFAKAIASQEEIVNATSNVPVYVADLAETLGYVGALQQQQRRFDLAANSLTKALDLWESLYAKSPDNSQYVENLARTSAGLRLLLRDSGDVRLATNTREAFTRVLGVLPKSETASPAARHALREAAWGRAEAGSKLGDQEQARADWKQAIELSANRPDAIWVDLSETIGIARAGAHADAAVRADKMAKQVTKSGEAAYYLACAYSLCADAAMKDTDLNSDERRVHFEHYIERGIDLLKVAQTIGYLKTARVQEKLKAEPDLEALRTSAAFATLLKPM
jgi:serine/threonine-protein kinase